MAASQHFSPGDVQFQLVYDRGQFSESSYLNRLPIFRMAPVIQPVGKTAIPKDTPPARADTSWASTAGLTTIMKIERLRNENEEWNGMKIYTRG